MNAMNFGERKLTEGDFSRLSSLSGRLTTELAQLLDEADIVNRAEMPADVVTLYAPVEIEDVATRHRQQLVLCEPEHTEPKAGLISVLSPVGTALLGVKVGSAVRWRLPTGQEGAAKVVSVQPQAQPQGAPERAA